MTNHDENQKPNLVLNPQTGKYFDINPLIQFLGVYEGSLIEASNTVDDIIKFVATNTDTEGFDSPQSDVLNFKRSLFNLYAIRDMFKEMTKFKESIH